MRIGVFDSGIGGEAVATELRKLIKKAEVIAVNDHEHVPYGSRQPDEIISLTKNAIQPLISIDCDAIVIACNTATTVAISSLRKSYPNVNFIGIEPMIKPASQITKTNCIAVCATPGTLKSKQYRHLKNLWTKNIYVIEPDCSKWAELIESGELNKIDVESVVDTLIMENVDVIVLGCTHFHWLKKRIIQSAGSKIKVLEPSDAIASRTKSLIY
ncbi:MAG: glutamate racemase [Candidatus Saccharibacteria bacterium]|nr:glutamate racemase [Candidatus Saccharibacteria bacterium]